MSVTSVDNSWEHLFPPFRSKLQNVLEEAERATGHKWLMTEGFRSQARQTYLYAQGRTRPGKVVTWIKIPKRHGNGLAADCYPSTNGRTPNFSLPHSNYIKFRQIYLAAGLVCPPWRKGDYGHVEWPEADTKTTLAAKAWVRAGFPPSPHITPTPAEIPVYVEEDLIPDADGFRRGDAVWVALRPVAEALDWQIKDATEPTAILEDDREEVSVPITLRGGRGFSPVKELCEALGVVKQWDGKAVRIS